MLGGSLRIWGVAPAAGRVSKHRGGRKGATDTGQRTASRHGP